MIDLKEESSQEHLQLLKAEAHLGYVGLKVRGRQGNPGSCLLTVSKQQKAIPLCPMPMDGQAACEGEFISGPYHAATCLNTAARGTGILFTIKHLLNKKLVSDTENSCHDLNVPSEIHATTSSPNSYIYWQYLEIGFWGDN